MCEHNLFEVTIITDEVKKYICMYCDYKEQMPLVINYDALGVHCDIENCEIKRRQKKINKYLIRVRY